MKKVFKKGFFYLVAFSMVFGNSVLSIDFSLPVAHAEGGDKVTICHATGSESNPWERINVSVNAQGAHLDHAPDIIVEDNDNTYQCPETGPYCGDENLDEGLGEECDDGPNGSDSCTSECTFVQDGQCTLEITKSDEGYDPIMPGDNIVYELTITNTGDATCTSVRVKDYFDDNTSYVSHVTDMDFIGAESSYVGWGMSSLDPGESETIELTMLVSEEAQCDSTLVNEAKFLSEETGWSEGDEIAVEETSVVCEEEPEYYTIKASKVVCEEEIDLPNWGDGSSGTSEITATTAQDYVDNSQGRCWLEEDWAFQWGTDVSDAGRDFVGEAGSGWNNFDTTTGSGTMAEVSVEADDLDLIKVREVLPEGYIPFAWNQGYDEDGTDDNVSAEIYCYDDILNYDNYDFVRNPEVDNIYYCVAFNIEEEIEEPEECSLEDSILVNGSFEEPEVTNSSLWQKFSNVLGWVIEKVSDESATTLELHRGWSGNEAAHGWQYSELDGDHSTKVSQTATTEAGATYKLFWSFAGRHKLAAEQNNLAVEVDGSQVATNGPTTASAPLSSSDWENSTYEFMANSTSTEVAFKDIGTPDDTLGTYVDNVRLCKTADPVSYCGDYTTDEGEECDDGEQGSEYCTDQCTLVYSPFCGDGEVNQDWEQCEPSVDEDCTEQCQPREPEQCSDLTLARYTNTEVSNEGNGDMTSDVFLGSDSYRIPSGAWFPVFWQGNPYNLDADIANYEDVPGLAVQRLANSVRTVMHASQAKADVEIIDSTLEFYNANTTSYNSDNSGNNKLEDSGDHPDVLTLNSQSVDFYLWANTGDDGFYTNWSIIEDCDDPEYSPYCGDGVVDPTWEQCDPAADTVTAATIQVGCSDQCQYITNQCSDLVAAKVNVDYVENWGNGNMSSDLFLGSDSYRIPQGVWFPLYLNGNYFLDTTDIASYEDVDGLAVQRLENSLRTVMYGTGTGDDKEHVSGDIELYNASVLTQVSDNSNDTPGNNKLEDTVLDMSEMDGVGSYDAGNDEVWIDDNKSFYWLTTTTADDGFYTNWEIVDDCSEDPICYEEGDSFFASTVESYEQGDRKDGSDVDPLRSVPEQGLELELGQNVSNFFSLGFGGWIVVSFDDIFVDGPGNDIKITEDTWGGGYPIEKADVYASQDGSTWEYLGEADNTNLENIHTTSEFDLGVTNLNWGQYIKIVDTSDPELHNNSGDGYDLNAVEALSGGYFGECVEDNIPVITRLGDEPVEVVQGTSYTDAGATADDVEDGDLTSEIVTNNPVDISTLGTYIVTYNVKDSDNNDAVEVTRTVNVVDGDTPPPVCVGCGGGGSSSVDVSNINAAVSCQSTTVSWDTSRDSLTWLYYGDESGNYSYEEKNDTYKHSHSVLLENLDYDTTYYYQIATKSVAGVEDKNLEISFTTLSQDECVETPPPGPGPQEVLGEKIEAEPLICDFLRASGSTGVDPDVDGVFEYPNGSLLRDYCDRGEGVYLIKDQMKWHVPNWKYLHDNHFGQRIYNVLSTVIDSYPDWTSQVLGVKTYGDGTLLRTPDARIYVIDQGKAKHISNLQELSKYAGQDIINVDYEVLAQY